MNTDDAPEYVAPNEYINAENIRFGGHLHGKSNRGELIESNREIVNASLPAGTNTLNGKIKDTIKDRIIYFLHNSSGNHSIVVFNQKTETFLVAVENTDITGGLGFSLERYIHSIDLVGDIIYWVDYPMPQRKLNIEAALKAKNPGYTGTAAAYTIPISQNVTTAIRKPGNYPVTCEKIEEAGIQTNQIRTLGFRFSYRYVYRDGETSTLAMHSRLVPPNWPGEEFNAIRITLPLAEKIDQDVTRIELVVFYSEDEKAFTIHRWDKRNTADATAIANHNSGTALTHVFSNNTVGTALNVVEKTKPFDSVPVTSAAQAIIKNRLFYGRNLLGYTAPNKTSLTLSQVEIPDTNFETVMDYTSLSYTYVTADGDEKEIGFSQRNGPWPDFSYNGGTKIFTYNGAGITDGNIKYELQATWNKDTAIPFILRMYKNGTLYKSFTWESSVQLTPISTLVLGTVTDVDLATGDTFRFDVHQINTGATWSLSFSTGSTSFQILQNTGNSQNGLQVNKSDAAILGGMVFYDQHMRQCGVVTNSGIIYTSPDRTYDATSDYNYLIQWAVTNGDPQTEIPNWAYYYAPVFSKNLRTNFFLQSRASDISYCAKDAVTGLFTGLGTTNAYAQGLAGVAVKADLLFGYGMGYAYNEGDILKIHIGSFVHRTPIKAVQGDWIIAEPIDVGSTTSAAALFEIFTPKQNNADALFFEVGQIYPVTNPTLSTRQYSTLSGAVPPECFLVSRKDGANNSYYVEAMNPSDSKWKIWITNHGRVQVYDLVGQQFLQGGISWSNTFITASTVNGLSSFDALNTYILDEEFGPIQKLLNTIKTQQDGGVLLAICEDECASLYIGERQVFDASGTSSLLKTDDVIGQVNKLSGSIGTRHPESVASEDNFALWFDVIRGAIGQYSQAGLDAVSKYKTKRFWKNYSDTYRKLPDGWWAESEQRNVIVGEIDTWNGEYLISLPAVNEIPGLYPRPFDILDGRAKTMAYSIAANKWVGSYTFYAEGMAYLNNVLYTFKQGDLYAHDVKDNQCRFFGVANRARLMVAETAGSFDAVKVWRTISIIGNMAPEYVLMVTNWQHYQETDLYGNQFKPFEGKWYASLLRNKFTPGLNTTDGLMRGENMRGQVCYVNIEFSGNGTETERIYINSLHFGVVLSKGHIV